MCIRDSLYSDRTIPGYLSQKGQENGQGMYHPPATVYKKEKLTCNPCLLYTSVGFIVLFKKRFAEYPCLHRININSFFAIFPDERLYDNCEACL